MTITVEVDETTFFELEEIANFTGKSTEQTAGEMLNDLFR